MWQVTSVYSESTMYTEASYMVDDDEEEGELSRIARAVSELASAVGGLGVKGFEGLVLMIGRAANGMLLGKIHKRSEVPKRPPSARLAANPHDPPTQHRSLLTCFRCEMHRRSSVCSRWN